MIATLILTSLASPYMQHASYPGASIKEDTTAPGGHATSNNLPLANTGKTPQVFTHLFRNGDKVEITLSNVTQDEIWITAADGNLRLWLEAKQNDKWLPIQYHQWYTCGNSYHRVVLQPGFHFTYKPIIPSGTYATEIRLGYNASSIDGPQHQVQYSSTIKANIDPKVFSLDPELSKTSRIRTDWAAPTLVPKG